MKDLAPGTIVVTMGGLGEIQKVSMSASARGYQVIDLNPGPWDGWGTHFAPAHTIRPAVVGETVCETVAGGCWCGLRHVSTQ